MPIEGVVNRIDDLDVRWPRNADIVREGAQHIRNIKTALKQLVADEVGTVKMFFGTVGEIPPGWAVCDGANGTPDMRGRVPVGAGGAYALGDSGGANSVTLTTAQMPAHGHAGSAENGGAHTHSGTAESGGAHGHSGTAESAGNHRHTQLGSGTGRGGLGQNNQDMVLHNTGYTGYAGAHTHSVSIPTSGAHSHSVSVDEGGAHSHVVTVGNTGGGESHENRMPFRALFFIMKLES